MKKQKSKKKPAAKKAKKPAAKKKAAKKPAKVKAQKKKKSTPVKAKKKTVAKAATKKTVKVKAKAKPKGTKKTLPGYPHYSAKDDIMNPANKTYKVSLREDVELTTKKGGIAKEEWNEEPFLSEVKNKKGKSSSTLTKEDQDLLGSDELNPDTGDDIELKDRVWPVDMTGEDLDIPGAELDDENEILGGEDEENKNFSIGGDRHEDLDENND